MPTAYEPVNPAAAPRRRVNGYEEFIRAMKLVYPSKDPIPFFTDIDAFTKWYKQAYDEFKKREPIVGDEKWFGLLKNVYENLNTRD